MTMTGSEETEARLRLLHNDVEVLHVNAGLVEDC